jgi:hypothetical protein
VKTTWEKETKKLDKWKWSEFNKGNMAKAAKIHKAQNKMDKNHYKHVEEC